MSFLGSRLGQSHTDSSQYRSDIDGLRAIAVLAVVIFHLDKTWFPRGFLGVDLFFVISGFLITRVIWNEALERRFSITDFYRRRVRRLMPALITVLIATSIASALILLPTDLVGYAKSVVSALAFVANIYFWRDTNYFAQASEEKPLLNLWSLSVEEQFYIFFPLLLVLLVRFPRLLLPTIWILTLGSLGTNIYLLKIGGASPAFYLLPSRAWELGAGALVALHAPAIVPRAMASVLRCIAMALIIGGMAYIGPWLKLIPEALPVVFGTALLIWIGAFEKSALGRALAWPLTNFIGQISYSLYLWHWPVIVLAKYSLVRQPHFLELFLMAFTSLCLAVVTWRFVEQPFRKREMPFIRVGIISGLGAAGVTLLAIGLILGQGWPGRLSAEAASINRSVGTHYRCPVSQLQSFGSSRACNLTLRNGDPKSAKVVLVGNSHAQMYAPLISDVLESADVPGMLVPLNACLPMISVNLSANCVTQAKTNLKAIIALPAVDTVIVALDWPVWKLLVQADGTAVDKSPDAALAQAMLTYAEALSPRKVIVVGPIAVPGFNVASVLGRQIRFGITPQAPLSIDRTTFEAKNTAIFGLLGTAPSLILLRPDLVQCNDARCLYVDDGLSFFADSNHLSQHALARFAPIFDEVLKTKTSIEVGPVSPTKSTSDF